MNETNIEITSFLFTCVSIIIINFLSLKFLSKKKIFLDQNFTKPQSFHSTPVPRIGGILLFISLTAIFFEELKYGHHIPIYLVCTSCFILGLLDDIKFFQNPIGRFVLFFLTIYSLSFLYDLKIHNFNIIFIDELNKNIYFSTLLITFCIFVSVNGSNLIDGFNGLVIINSILITIALIIVSHETNNYYVLEKCIYFLLCLLLLLSINFPLAKIFMGDSGAYLCGAFIALMSIELNATSLVSPFFLAILNGYFFIEMAFSIIRKLYEKKSPFYPDNNHLHMILYRVLIKKKSKNTSNYLTSLIINTYFAIVIMFSLFFYRDSFVSLIIFLTFILFYILFYLILRKISFDNKK